MLLKTFSFQGTGTGTIVLDDDATKTDIFQAMYLDATEESGNNGKPGRKIKEDTDGNAN